MPESFDLNVRIQSWRNTLEARGTFDATTLDELEGHLWDTIDGLMGQGLSEREAFVQACFRLGHEDTLAEEYRKVTYWSDPQRPWWHHFTWRFVMFNSYLKIAFRAMLKQKGYAFINIFSLAIGIAFCALIFLFVRDELTYDQFHEKADQIYRVNSMRFAPDGSIADHYTYMPYPAGPALVTDLPEVEEAVRFITQDYHVRHLGELIPETMLYTDPSVFEVFTFPLLQGEPTTALRDVNAIVLTEQAAERYFGQTNPIGQPLTIRFDNGAIEDLIVTGVTENVPSTSSIQFDFLLPLPKLLEIERFVARNTDTWTMGFMHTYVQLTPDATQEQVQAKLPEFWRTYLPDETQKFRDMGQWTGDGDPFAYEIQPISDLHLNTEVRGGLVPASNPMYSYILSGMALIILIIACINFMTLAIGRSARRAKEIGLRKVVGAQRLQLIGQFWGEALLMSLLALIVGLVLAALFLPTFNNLAGRTLHFNYLSDGLTWVVLISIMLVTGLLAGSYPALVLSGFRPVDSLKNRLKLSGSNGFTKSLVVVQFALSVMLIISTLTMSDQLAYTRTKNLGFNQEQVVVVRTGNVDGDVALERFRNELGSHANILNITATSHAFPDQGIVLGMEYEDNQFDDVNYFRVDHTYLNALDIELLEGRTFDPNLVTDSTDAILVNEALVRMLEIQEPLGAQLSFLGAEDDAPRPTIIGVIKDFNFVSLHEEVPPMLLTLESTFRYKNLLVRVSPNDIPGSLTLLQNTWETIAPDTPFNYSFLDEDMQALYAADERWGTIVQYASIFAVLIACLGLFGIASLTTAGRTKEVGIRKVLGAPVGGITLLLSKDFVKLVIIGVVLAIPIAYLAMQQWLAIFAYRIEISAITFVLAGVAAILIAFLTVSYQSIKAALTDPVKSLRYE